MSDLIITPNRGTLTGVPQIQFFGASGSGVSLQVLADGTVAFMGDGVGMLFAVQNSLSGSLQSTAGVDGLPVMEIFDDSRVVMGQYSPGRDAIVISGRRLGIGTASPLASLHVTGAAILNGNGGSAAPVLIGTTGASGVGALQLAIHTTTAGGIGFGPDFTLARLSAGSCNLHATSSVNSLYLSNSTTSVGAHGLRLEQNSVGTATVGNSENGSLVLVANNTAGLTVNANTTVTLASGLILGSSTVTGGGVAFGGNAVVHALSANDLQISHPNGGLTSQYLYGGGSSMGLFNGAASAGEGILFAATPHTVTLQTANTTALIADGSQNVTAYSGLFFRSTGDYTLSGVVSHAALRAVSGVLAASAGGGGVPAARVVIPVTGNFTITGGNTNAYMWTGVATYGAVMPQPSVYSGQQLIVKNLSRTSNLILSGSIDYDTNYTLIPRAAVTMLSDAVSWTLI